MSDATVSIYRSSAPVLQRAWPILPRIWQRLARVRRRLQRIDPRWLQIATLCAFLAYARFDLGQRITALNALAALAGSLLSELCCARSAGRTCDLRSPLITGLSLTLMLRTASPWLMGAAAVFAIAAKYLVRVRGKQLFNPSNIAIVALTCATPYAWISTGQWGQTATLVAGIGCLGVLVCARATRLDLALSFIALWAGALIGRALWLGDPLQIPLHQLQDGALLIFSFFMITDPRATPDHRGARVLFAALVVAVAYYLRFALFQPDGVLRALAVVSLLTPALDCWLRAGRFRWRVRTLKIPVVP